jgi:hypothetical protein
MIERSSSQRYFSSQWTGACEMPTYRTLRDGSFEDVFPALRARLRSVLSLRDTLADISLRANLLTSSSILECRLQLCNLTFRFEKRPDEDDSEEPGPNPRQDVTLTGDAA